jgi:hypothetical protein
MYSPKFEEKFPPLAVSTSQEKVALILAGEEPFG